MTPVGNFVYIDIRHDGLMLREGNLLAEIRDASRKLRQTYKTGSYIYI